MPKGPYTSRISGMRPSPNTSPVRPRRIKRLPRGSTIRQGRRSTKKATYSSQTTWGTLSRNMRPAQLRRRETRSRKISQIPKGRRTLRPSCRKSKRISDSIRQRRREAPLVSVAGVGLYRANSSGREEVTLCLVLRVCDRVCELRWGAANDRCVAANRLRTLDPRRPCNVETPGHSARLTVCIEPEERDNLFVSRRQEGGNHQGLLRRARRVRRQAWRRVRDERGDRPDPRLRARCAQAFSRLAGLRFTGRLFHRSVVGRSWYCGLRRYDRNL